MCGVLFIHQKKNLISKDKFIEALNKQSWRGPDNLGYRVIKNNSVLLGHNRLSVVDMHERSNQPMQYKNNRYSIIFNGEIYNHKEIVKDLKLCVNTESDTEVIVAGYEKIGKRILEYLDGMFAFIIYDEIQDEWFAARDRFAIKPLYIFQNSSITIIGSESGVLGSLMKLSIDETSISEWKYARRPVPGYTFFKNLKEFPRACYLTSGSNNFTIYWTLENKSNGFSHDEFQQILIDSINEHQMGDAKTVSLLSGGLDSSIITKYSNSVEISYTVGLNKNNEFIEAQEIANSFHKELKIIRVDNSEVISAWKELTKLRNEPLSVPNEGLIYLVCKSMSEEEKVVLTGEGADELLFGYDRIFRWAASSEKFHLNDFLSHYSYSGNENLTDRFKSYVNQIFYDKDVINGLEDFFIDFHLPGLLRRMDFSSMAASKESRVPFVTRKLFEYIYRLPYSIKIDNEYSKKPLREFAIKSNLNFILNRRKIGFSSTMLNHSRVEEYNYFQSLVLGELNW